jgi:hypothetical protein
MATPMNAGGASSGMPQQMPMHTPGTQMGMPSGMQSGMQPGMPSGMQPGMPSGMQPGMQPGVNSEMPYYYNPNMPYISFAPYQGIPNMYIPSSNPYNVPMGIPLFPLYGYDSSADLDRDLEYMKQLYPRTARAIQKEIDDECDKMEYDGSAMFDEYPDKEYLEKLIDRVYDRIKKIDDEPKVEANSLYFYPPRRNPNYLRDIVTLLLLSEIYNRRRRHRSRRRWF